MKEDPSCGAAGDDKNKSLVWRITELSEYIIHHIYRSYQTIGYVITNQSQLNLSRFFHHFAAVSLTDSFRRDISHSQLFRFVAVLSSADVVWAWTALESCSNLKCRKSCFLFSYWPYLCSLIFKNCGEPYSFPQVDIRRRPFRSECSTNMNGETLWGSSRLLFMTAIFDRRGGYERHRWSSWNARNTWNK